MKKIKFATNEKFAKQFKKLIRKYRTLEEDLAIAKKFAKAFIKKKKLFLDRIISIAILFIKNLNKKIFTYIIQIKHKIYYRLFYRIKHWILYIWKKIPFTNISIFLLILFFVVELTIKNKNFSISNLNIPWEAIIAIVTALAWVSQHKLNKKLLEKESIAEQKERLENFKNKKIKWIRDRFKDSLEHWFIYTFEHYQYKIQNNHWSEAVYSFKPIQKIISHHFYDSPNYEYIEEINLKTFGVVYKNYKFLYNETQIIAKDNPYTNYFDKLGRLFSGGQSFETFKINENKLSHLILKSLNGGHNCIIQLLIEFSNIKNDFENQNLRIEAYKLLFQEDSYFEIYEIIRIVFWFKKQSFIKDSHQKARVMKIIKMMFKKYKHLKQIDKDLKKLESLFFDLFGTNFLNCHPYFN